MAGRARLAKTCLTCETEFEGAECPFCGGPGRPGSLRDFCPHGKRKPYRGWPCPACRQTVLDVARYNPG